MSRLDLNYIANLMQDAQGGDSNAFAEFFAATYQKQYAFSFRCLKSESLAQEALQDTYLHALKDLSKVQDTRLIVAWLTQNSIRSCMNIRCRNASGKNGRPVSFETLPVQIEGSTYPMQQILNLPFSESQTLLLRYLCGLSDSETASLTELRKREVRRYRSSGLERLKQLGRPKEADA